MKDSKTNLKESFLKATQKDPFITAIIWNIIALGMKEFTDNGTLILIYENSKTGMHIVIDPASPNLFIKDTKENIKLNIPIELATKFTKEAYGRPVLKEIPKFGISTNLIPKTEA